MARKPPQRRRRRTKGEIDAASALVKPQSAIAVKVNGMDLEGQAADLALLLKAMQN